jgi:hypothetical protein
MYVTYFFRDRKASYVVITLAGNERGCLSALVFVFLARRGEEEASIHSTAGSGAPERQTTFTR